jgi:hypothetical protein
VRVRESAAAGGLAIAVLAGCAHSLDDPSSLSPSDRLRWYQRIVIDETRRFTKMVGSQDMAPVMEVDHATSYRVRPIPFVPPDAEKPPIPEGDPDFASRPSPGQLLGIFVVLPGGTPVAPQRAASLAAVLVDPRSYTGAVSGCFFEPESVVRFRRAAKTLDFYFDAACEDVALVVDGRRLLWRGILAVDATKILREITEGLAHQRTDDHIDPPE